MKSCINCGIELRDDEYFCGGCGSYQPDGRSLDIVKNDVQEEAKIKGRNIYERGSFRPEEKSYEMDMSMDEAVDTFSNKPVKNEAYKPLAVNDELVNKSKKNRRTKSHMGTLGKVICVIAIIVLFFWAKDRFLESSEKIAEGFLGDLCEMKSDKILDYCYDGKEETEEAKELKVYLSEIKKFEAQYNLSYKINNNKELSSLEKKEFWKNLSSETMFIDEENDDLKEFTVYNVAITSNDLSSGETENLTVELYVGKVKGKWKVIGIDEKE